MRVTLSIAMAAVALAAAPAPGAAERPEPPLRAGAASGDITPPIGTPMFAYTARSRVFSPGNNADLLNVLADPDHGLHAKTFVGSTGIHTRLRARAVVIESKGVPFALVQVDLGGLPYSLTQAVAARIADTGITEERLLISATHTHSAQGAIWPNADNAAYGAVGGDVYDHRSWSATLAGIEEAIREAVGELQPARVGVGATEVTDASRNRAGEPFAKNPEAGRISAIDPELTVLRVDSSRGRPLAVWSNFAIHATSLGDGNRLFSGDNPGYSERIVERRIGRGVVNVWTNGNEGDISPDGGAASLGGQAAQHVPSEFSRAHLAGARVADGILEAWERAGNDMRGELDLQARQSYLGFDGTAVAGEPVGPAAVLGGGGIALPDESCAPVENMAGPGQGRKFPIFGGVQMVPNVAPVSVWQVGDLAIAAVPSEVTRTMGLRIREAVAGASGGRVGRVALAGMTDGYLSYTATPEEYEACQYEGSFTLFGRQQGPRYRDFLSGLAASLFLGARPPAAAPRPLPFGGEPGAAPPPRRTEEPGRVVEQPAPTATRLGRVSFRWQGGDRAVEAPRGQTFVRLQRRTRKGWETVATDDSYADTVRRVAGDVYVETFQFDRCDPLGVYRFKVTGRAYDGSRAEPYSALSREFTLEPAALEIDAPVVSGGVATVRARYPSPGADALIFTRRLVTEGTAVLLVDGERVTVHADPATGTFTTPATGAVAVERVADDCGNRGA